MTPEEAGRIVLERVGWRAGARWRDEDGPGNIWCDSEGEAHAWSMEADAEDDGATFPDLTDHATQGAYLGHLLDIGVTFVLAGDHAKFRPPGPHPESGWLPIHEALARAVMAVTP